MKSNPLSIAYLKNLPGVQTKTINKEAASHFETASLFIVIIRAFDELMICFSGASVQLKSKDYIITFGGVSNS